MELRFERCLLKENINWTQTFNTDTYIFDALTTRPPRDLARSLTDSDAVEFGLLSHEHMVNEDSHLRRLQKQWDTLCWAIRDSLAVETHLSLNATYLAQASLTYLATLNLLT